MGTVFKREFAALMKTVQGYICMALLLAGGGFMLIVENFGGASPNLEGTLMSMELLLFLIIPLLAMNSVAGDRRRGMLRYYRSLPIGSVAVVGGKYTALLAVYAIPCAVLALFPLLLSLYGTINYTGAYVSLLCFFLLSAALLAVCQFLSALTDHAWIAAILGILAVVLLYSLPDFPGWYPSTALASYIGFAVVALLAAVAAWGVTRHWTVAAVTGAILVLPLSVLYLVKGEWFAELFPTAMEIASPFLHFEEMATLGILDLSSVLMILLTAAVFFVCTVLATDLSVRRTPAQRPAMAEIESDNGEDDESNTPAKPTLRGDGFIMDAHRLRNTKVFAWGAGILAAAILLGVLSTALPSKLTKFDVTGVGVTEISEETERLLGSITEDVTIYWFCPADEVDAQISLLLERYAEAGDHVAVKIVDPQSPGAETAAVDRYALLGLSNHDFVVESRHRYRVVEVEDLYYVVNEFVNEMNNGQEMRMTLEEWDQFNSLADAYAQYGIDISAYKNSIYFDGEAQLTAAVDYVAKVTIPHGYILAGDGFKSPNETVLRGFAALELSPTSLDLSTVTAIPDDAACLILYAPTRDITTGQAAMIHDYLNRGGSILMVTDPENVTTCPNIMGLAKQYGLSGMEGIVMAPVSDETDAEMSDVLTFEQKESESVVKLPASHAILMVPKDGIPQESVVTLFATSNKGIRVDPTDGKTQIGKADEYPVAAMVTRDIPTADGTNKQSHFVWYASSTAFTDTWIARSDGDNLMYLTITLQLISESYESPYAVLGADNLSGESLTGYSKNTVIGYGVVLVGILPVGLIVAGGLYDWCRRKRR